jgi:hypothetical protein
VKKKISVTIAALAALLGLTEAASARSRAFFITNNTASTITSMQASNIDEDRYDADNILAGYTVDVGESAAVQPSITDGYCRFDILIKFANKHGVQVRNVNLCKAAEIVIEGSPGNYTYSVN